MCLSLFTRSTDVPITRSLAGPVEGPFLPKIDVAREQNADVQRHLNEAGPSQALEHHRPGVEENGFHIEQNKEHPNKIETDGKGSAGITHGNASALIGAELLF